MRLKRRRENFRVADQFSDTQGRSILLACAELLGGMQELAKHLDVPEHQLAVWVAGRASPPPEILVKAVEPVIAANRKY